MSKNTLTMCFHSCIYYVVVLHVEDNLPVVDRMTSVTTKAGMHSDSATTDESTVTTIERTDRAAVETADSSTLERANAISMEIAPTESITTKATNSLTFFSHGI